MRKSSAWWREREVGAKRGHVCVCMLKRIQKRGGKGEKKKKRIVCLWNQGQSKVSVMGSGLLVWVRFCVFVVVDLRFFSGG